MSLKVKKSATYYIPRIAGAVAAVLAIIFLIRVFIWETAYYNEKEGSERDVASFVGDMNTTEEVSTEPVTEEQRAEYVVPADKPRYLSIEKLGVKNARIIEVGTLSNGQIATPSTNEDAGWWSGSAVPGTGGTAILDGHNGGNVEGIFKHLPRLTPGDEIKIELGDGTVLVYRVYDNITVPLKNASEKMQMLAVSPESGVESISIISCTGEWSYNQKTYLSRQFLRATLMSRISPEN